MADKDDPYRGRSGNTGLAAFDTVRAPIGWWAAYVLAALILFFAAVVHALPALRSSIFYEWPAAVIHAFDPSGAGSTPAAR